MNSEARRDVYINMSNVKEESEDVRIEQVFIIKQEDPEEQTDLTFRSPAQSCTESSSETRRKTYWRRMDVEGLISLVSDRRELFDQNHIDYKHIDKREALWQEIAEKIGFHVDDVKTKWKNLRDTYIRKKREDQCTGEQTPKKKKTWKFMKMMEFLATSSEQRRVHSSVKESADEVGDGSESEKSLSISVESAVSSEPVQANSKKRKRSVTPDFVEKYLAAKEVRDREREERRKQRMEDDISLFLMSLAPVIRRLPPSKQSSVKMRFHQVLHEVEYGLSDASQPPSAQHCPESNHRAPTPDTPPV